MVKKILRKMAGDRIYGSASYAKRSAIMYYRRAREFEPRLRPQTSCQTMRIGDWAICTDGLGPNAIMYAFGIGCDIAFELEIIARYGIEVHAFDPTPESAAWIRNQVLPAKFNYHEYGIAPFDGIADFHASIEAAAPEFSLVKSNSFPEKAVKCHVYRLGTILKMLGHEHVDILKMDVEGIEFEVLKDWLDEGIRVKQFIAEFHHRYFPQEGKAKTELAARWLKERGFELFFVSPIVPNYGFIKK